jgi:hypothetical protein
VAPIAWYGFDRDEGKRAEPVGLPLPEVAPASPMASG